MCMAAYNRTPSTYAWLCVNDLIDSIHEQYLKKLFIQYADIL